MSTEIEKAREWRSKNAERFTRIDAVTEFRDYSRYGGYDTDAMLDAYASEQVERLKPWLIHSQDCTISFTSRVPMRQWREGDAEFCTCGLAQALQTEKESNA